MIVAMKEDGKVEKRVLRSSSKEAVGDGKNLAYSTFRRISFVQVA